MTENRLNKILLQSGLRGEIRSSEEMKLHTTLRIGGPADLFIIPAGANDLIKLLDILTVEDIPYFILGRGSNLLVSDSGVRGIVIQVSSNLAGFSFREGRLLSEVGAAFSHLAQAAGERGLSGLEFAAGIPGTVGGAVVMNAGCWGGDISQVVSRIRTFKPGIGIKDWTADECRFEYRSSCFRGGGEIILEVEFQLEPGPISLIKERMEEIVALRKKSLPLEYPNAGSIFKNPPGDYAGRLIEEAGLKGKRVGGAQIAERHANIIVNRGAARSSDVEELLGLVRRKVKEKFGINLELEIEIW